jgi:hypothetical protein
MRARISAPSIAAMIDCAWARAARRSTPPSPRTRAMMRIQWSIARRPAAVIGGDCGAFSRRMVAIGQPERKPDAFIHPAITRQ